ncbi:MAG: hypothetical protein NXI24_08480 [bacterium]|nr:hypothetical protein [bacterium]
MDTDNSQKKSGDQKSVRVWQTLNVSDVRQHLLLVDDLYGSCGNCKQLGLNYVKDTQCSGCGTIFRYLATKLRNPADVAKILGRIKKESLKLTVIDRDDFERAEAKDAINNLFS